MYLENLNGGVLITLGNSVALPDEIKAQLLEKWEMANEDGEVDDLIAEAEKIAAPKAYVIPATIDELEEDHVTLSGIHFESTLMPQQLRPLYEKGGNPTIFAAGCGGSYHHPLSGTGWRCHAGLCDQHLPARQALLLHEPRFASILEY